MAPKRFKARVQGGMLVDLDREAIRRAVKEYEGQRVFVTITDQRSNEANAWLWGVALPMLAEHLGYEPHEREMLHYEMLAKRFGTVEKNGLVLPVTTSSNLSVKAFSDYMEWFVRNAAKEFGVVIPLPNEPMEMTA